jgi:hypothetical protein
VAALDEPLRHRLEQALAPTHERSVRRSYVDDAHATMAYAISLRYSRSHAAGMLSRGEYGPGA